MHKEYASNKFLSVNDYKAMTKQVMELRGFEQAYLDEESAILRNPRPDSASKYQTTTIMHPV